MTKKYAVDTDVPISRTKSAIDEELSRFGATSFAFGTLPGAAVVMFEFSGRRVRFDLPLPAGKTEAATAQLHRSLWRALFLSIKAKLVSVATGIETFEEAFLAHVVLADGSKVADVVRPEIEKQYLSGKMGPLFLGGPR